MCEHAAAGVEQRAAEIVIILYRWRVGSAYQAGRCFVDDRDQAIPKDLDRRGVEFCRHRSASPDHALTLSLRRGTASPTRRGNATSITSAPLASTTRWSPRPSTVVDSRSSISAA